VPELRRRLLSHPKAGKIVDLLTDLSQQGIEFHTQVVLCPGMNDGEALEITYRDLSAIEGVRSIALVPVGITAHREGLPNIRRYHLEEARSIIDWVNSKQQECRRVKNSAFIWLADEFYLIANKPLPEYLEYEDFPQLENGVGMVRLFWEEFRRIALPKRTKNPVKYYCVTGESGEYILAPVVKRLNLIEGVQIELKVIQNRYFGATITVTGLLTGACLLAGLKDVPQRSRVIIPDIMIKGQAGRFLDDITVEELANQLNIELIAIPAEPQSFVDRILVG
jgi:putative radical SAM enzyme (TIGR03279 family)